MMVAMQNQLQIHEMQMEDILALAGEDSKADEASSTTKYYNNDLTQDAVAAKTGTVTPAVTLAGVAHTQQGDVYFYFNKGRSGTRALIQTALVKMIQLFGGPKKIAYDAPEFSQVDVESLFVEITPSDKKLAAILPPSLF
jgi:hypothetical protein